jgi:hypothetical protein
VQFEFAGALDVPDGRYLARGTDAPDQQRVLIVDTTGAPPPSRRRRRKPKVAEPGAAPEPLPLTRATAVRAHEPFDSAEEAGGWLDQTIAERDALDAVVEEGVALLNRALHAHAVASANPRTGALGAEGAVTVRIGYGSGEEVAVGRFSVAHEIDVRTAAGSRRRRRDEELRPQERLAAVLGGRERIDACETLVLRARADLDAGRRREGALQLRVALEALLVELGGALSDPGHEKDMAELETRRSEAGEAANEALRGELDVEKESNVTELTAICERVLRRRRVLRG